MRKIFLSIGFITIAILATTVLLNISQASEKVLHKLIQCIKQVTKGYKRKW